DRLIDARAQVEACRPRRRALRQRQVRADSRVQDFELDGAKAGVGQNGSFVFLYRTVAAQSARARARTHLAVRRPVALGDQLDEPPREHRFRAFAERELASGPVDRQGVRLTVEAAIAADLV